MHLHLKEERFYGHKKNWNLLLTNKGKVRVLLACKENITIEPGTITLIEPGVTRLFMILEDWEPQWIHFNLDAHVPFTPEWPAVGPHVFRISPGNTEFHKIESQFSEVRSLCKIRQRGWYRLAYCIVQEIILRGNMVHEKGLDSMHIELAAKMLENLDNIDNIEKLAKKCSISRAGFFTKFKETFGVTPGIYREQQVMGVVQELLSNSDMTLKEIAQRTGFSNSFYLSNRFKKMFGISPTQYRKQYLKTLSGETD